jgi:uncharacterized protein (TIGR02996 family)
MTDAELLDAVAASPGEDEPRLRYAEILRRRGDPRGELIEVQCALAAAARRGAAPPDAVALRRREAELLAEHEQRWLEEMGLPEACASFARGFVAEVILRGGAYHQASDAFFRLQPLPLLRVVTAGFHDMVAIAMTPGVLALSSLEIDQSGKRGPEALQKLVASPFLTGLRSLAVRSSGVGAAGVEAITRSPTLGGLTRLDLSDGAIDAEAAVELLFLLERMPLTALILRRNALGEDGAHQLAETAPARSLGVLNLAGNAIATGGAAALASSPELAGLWKLSLWDNDIELAGAQAIAGSRYLAGLRVLDLGANPVGDEGAAAVAAMPGVRLLGLAHAGIGDAGAAALADRAPELASLDLRGNPLGAGAVARLRARFGDRVLVDQ